MKGRDERAQVAGLIDQILQRGFPRSVVLADERGFPKGKGPWAFQLYDHSRLSICLSRRGTYRILRNGVLTTVVLQRGDALVVSPGCLMASHPEARYLSFGLVFSAEMTRFLLAKRTPNSVGGRHRFLFAHHSSALMDEEIHWCFKTIEKACQREADPRYAAQLVGLVLLRAKDLSLSQKAMAEVRSGSFTWKAAKEYVDENLHRPLSREEIAEFLRIHPNHVSKLFRQFGGSSLRDYLMRARMEKARGLLLHPALRISEIAESCGIPDPNYFSRCFRKEHGYSPT
ncbi:MAG TPA: AraC family transcriptional regulator, partial [Prosthecobacter sp.]